MASKEDALQRINEEAVEITRDGIPVMTVYEQAAFIDKMFLAPSRASGDATTRGLMSVLIEMDVSPESFRETLDLCPKFREKFESYEALMIKDLGHSLLSKAIQLVHDENPLAIKTALDIAKQARAITADHPPRRREQIEVKQAKPRSRLDNVQVEDEDED